MPESRESCSEIITNIIEASQHIDNPEFRNYVKKHLVSNGDIVSGPLRHLKGHMELEGKRVLDMGCGFGLHSLLMANYGAKVTALEMTTERLEVLRELDRLIENVQVKPVFGSALELPFEEGEFDIVYCNQFISHVSDFTGAVEQAKRVLKKGGTIAICDTNRKTLLTTYFTEYSTRKKYQALEKKIMAMVEDVVAARLKEKDASLPEEDQLLLAKLSMGMLESGIHKVVDAHLEHKDPRTVASSIEVKFRYRHPGTGYYYERFFAPSDVEKRLLAQGFGDIRIHSPFEGRFEPFSRLFPGALGQRLAQRLFVSTYCVLGEKL